MDEPTLLSSPGGVARVPIDFTYEVVVVNRRVLARLKNEDPGPFDSSGWMVAPEDFRNKRAAIDGIRESTNAVLEAWDALPEGDINKSIPLESGETTALKAASMCATHLVYHDAQLNFVQSLAGDDEMHWQ